jgi:hypothetical protein
MPVSTILHNLATYYSIYEPNGRSLCYKLGLQSDSKPQKGEMPTLDAWMMEKSGNKYKIRKAGSSFRPFTQTEDIGNNSMKAGTYGLKTCNMWLNILQNGPV